ncbi:MAG TPA: carbohydrate kinase family protein [Feifaniaceae bacterium]|nr:carbohydrate kinase family protein [Feifaniaceae bacterium]
MSNASAGRPESPAMPPVVVIGGMNMDVLGTPRAPLLMRDSNPGTVTLRPGGVGRNIAWGLARLGLPVELITAAGNDTFGAALLKSCEEDGIGTSHTVAAPCGSGVYLCVHDAGGDMLCAINQMEAVETLSPEILAPLVPILNAAPLVALDANLPAETLSYLAETVKAPLFADPVSAHKAERLLPILPRVYAIKPNRLEAEVMTGFDCSAGDNLGRAADFFLERGVKRVYISLGKDGVYYADGRDRGVMPSMAAPDAAMRDFTGAGDAMTAGLIWGELCGCSAAGCAQIGIRAAGARVLTGTLDASMFHNFLDPHEHLQ